MQDELGRRYESRALSEESGWSSTADGMTSFCWEDYVHIIYYGRTYGSRCGTAVCLHIYQFAKFRIHTAIHTSFPMNLKNSARLNHYTWNSWKANRIVVHLVWRP